MSRSAQTLAFLKNNRAAKTALYVLGTILLGAVSSGVWEFALKHLTVSLGNFMLAAVATIWAGYVDVLHADVGKLHTDLFSTPIFLVLASFAIFGPLIATFWLLQEVGKLQEEVREGVAKVDEPLIPPRAVTRESILEDYKNVELRALAFRWNIWFTLAPLALLASGMFALMVWQLAYTRAAGNWADRSIEILRPQITLEEHLLLRSKLRSVTTADDFYRLEQRLRDLEAKVDSKLPAFITIRPFGAQS